MSKTQDIEQSLRQILYSKDNVTDNFKRVKRQCDEWAYGGQTIS